MKRSTAEAALPPSAEAPTKSQRRSTPPTTNPAAAENGRTSRGQDGGGGGKISNAAETQQSPSLPPAPAPAPETEELAAGWCDGGATAAELGEWWWCLCGVEEEKLSGWFPFAEEDFLCGNGGGEGGRLEGGEEDLGGELLWEAADIDIWQLQHIHEIPRATSK